MFLFCSYRCSYRCYEHWEQDHMSLYLARNLGQYCFQLENHLESLADNGICTSTPDPINESLQQSLGEMKEVLQSKPFLESNYTQLM